MSLGCSCKLGSFSAFALEAFCHCSVSVGRANHSMANHKNVHNTPIIVITGRDKISLEKVTSTGLTRPTLEIFCFCLERKLYERSLQSWQLCFGVKIANIETLYFEGRLCDLATPNHAKIVRGHMPRWGLTCLVLYSKDLHQHVDRQCKRGHRSVDEG